MSNLFREALIRKGVNNGVQLARYLESPAVIFFLTKDWKPYAELRFRNDGGAISVSRIWPPRSGMSLSEIRRETVETAKQQAASSLALPHWTGAPFSNCWLPSGLLAKARQELLGEGPKTG